MAMAMAMASPLCTFRRSFRGGRLPRTNCTPSNSNQPSEPPFQRFAHSTVSSSLALLLLPPPRQLAYLDQHLYISAHRVAHCLEMRLQVLHSCSRLHLFHAHCVQISSSLLHIWDKQKQTCSAPCQEP